MVSFNPEMERYFNVTMLIYQQAKTFKLFTKNSVKRENLTSLSKKCLNKIEEFLQKQPYNPKPTI